MSGRGYETCWTHVQENSTVRFHSQFHNPKESIHEEQPERADNQDKNKYSWSLSCRLNLNSLELTEWDFIQSSITKFQELYKKNNTFKNMVSSVVLSESSGVDRVLNSQGENSQIWKKQMFIWIF